MKVLIIEDNHELAETVLDFLKREAYVCEHVDSFASAQDKIVSFPYDCIVLDIMLPDGNGLNLLRFIRENRKDTSVLIISAKNALDDKVAGLESGADDYLTKPFHLPELHARLKALYRRKRLGGDEVIEFNEISVNTSTLDARVHGEPLDLTRKEFDLLVYLLTNKNRVLTRQSIAANIWVD